MLLRMGFSLVAASADYSSSRCTGFSLRWPLLLRSTGSRRTGSVVVAHRLSCSVACGIFLDQGLNPCPLHWQVDSLPLRHQGSPWLSILNIALCALSIPNSQFIPPPSLTRSFYYVFLNFTYLYIFKIIFIGV